MTDDKISIPANQAKDISDKVFGRYTHCMWNTLDKRWYSEIDERKYVGSNLLLWLFAKPAPSQDPNLTWFNRTASNT